MLKRRKLFSRRMNEARLRSLPKRDAAFVEPMECLAVSKLPDGPQWLYEIKLERLLGQELRPGSFVRY
jgi:hypothetical protein